MQPDHPTSPPAGPPPPVPKKRNNVALLIVALVAAALLALLGLALSAEPATESAVVQETTDSWIIQAIPIALPILILIGPIAVVLWVLASRRAR